PILINWLHMWQLAKDAWRTKNLGDKFKLWFMPTGWRPKDVIEKYPVEYIRDPYTQVKYDPKASLGLHLWSWFQYLMVNFLLVHMLLYLTEIGFPMLFLYGGFLFLMIYSYSALMDLEKIAIWLEAIKSAIGLGIIYLTGDWFFLNSFIPGGTIILSSYFVISVLVVFYFVQEFKTEKISEVENSRV
ncbi:MAG: alkylglycerol monooxygenase, partial [Saprospiraceae bacterium]